MINKEPQHRGVERLGVAVCYEVVAVQDGQLRTGDGAGNEACVAVLDHILVAGHDQRGARDVRQFLGRDVGVVDHQAQHLGVAACLLAAAGEEARQAVAHLDGQLHARLHPTGVEVGAVEDEPFHPLGVLHGEDHRDIAAVGEA